MKRTNQKTQANVAPVVRTPEEMQADYAKAIDYVTHRLQAYVERGAKARATIAEKLSKADGSVDVLVNIAKWGDGVVDDLMATVAARTLHIAGEHGLERALEWAIEEATRALIHNYYDGKSTNPYSNAVDSDRRRVNEAVARDWSGELQLIRQYRADVEFAAL